MKHEIKNLSPEVPMGGEGSFVIDGIHYSIYREPTEKIAGSVLVSRAEKVLLNSLIIICRLKNLIFIQKCQLLIL